MSFFVYENWVADGHKARIHLGECGFCKDGNGVHPGSSERNGKWHGPFSSYRQAFDEAVRTGGHVSQCKFCNPQEK
jgi:F-type H+/Na+-transporting ATPase subunit beta